MNKERRKQIAKAAGLITEARELIDACKDEEQEYFDAMPEGLQSGAKGDEAQEHIDRLEQASSDLENVEAELGEYDNCDAA